MINDGQIYLAGFVATQPTRKINGGKVSASMRVAFTPRWISRETGEWSDGPTSFVNVTCWRALAENVVVSLRKGEPVLIMGRLRVRRYDDKEGVARTAVEVEASSIGHDLTRGVSAFSRTRRAFAGTAGDQGQKPDAPASEDPGRESAAEFAANGQAVVVDGAFDESAVAELTRQIDEELDGATVTF